MKDFLKRHVKLIEAVGLILVLSAWILEWQSVRESVDADGKLRASITSLQDAWSFANVSAVVQLEAAVTRVIRSGDTKSEDPLGTYALAWEDAEVRRKWTLRISNTIGLIQTLLSVLKETDLQYHLVHNERLTSLDSELNSVQESLVTTYSVDSLSRGVPVPEPTLLRGRDAGMIDRQLTKLHQELLPLLNDTVARLKDRASRRSSIYRFAFLVGSVFLVFGKLTDWRRERRPSHAK